MSPRQRKVIFIILFLLSVVAIMGIIWAILWKTTYSASIYVTFTPSSATATLGGKKISAGTIVEKPGKYEFVVSKSGFTTSTQIVTLTAGNTTNANAILQSNSASTANWYLDHPEDQTINQAITATTVTTAGNTIQNDFKIASVLPLTGQSYQIDYGSSPTKPGKYALFITYYTDTGKQDALDQISSLGYNPSDYEIIYTDAT